MQKHTIEIDEEIFELLKKQAEPFVDSPNDVLRRLLLKDKSSSHPREKKTNQNAPPSVPAGTPKALEQTLQVIFLAHRQNISRPKATKIVAELHGVKKPTVQDKYCRQLNLSASDLDKLLSETNLNTLKDLLIKKYSNYKSLIHNYLNNA